MDFKKEYDKVKDTTYFKPEAGVYKVTFKDDGLKGTSNFKDGSSKPSITFLVDVDNVGTDIPWTMVIPAEGEVIGSSSRYGQLITCGKAWGTLVGKSIILRVTGMGQSKRYAIDEASELKKKADNNGVEIVESSV